MSHRLRRASLHRLPTPVSIHASPRLTAPRQTQWKRTYQPGVSFSGVGIHIKNNDISQAPHQAVSGSGNENLVESNYIHDVCFEASDSGAFYCGRSWSQRANKVVNNTFENVRATEPTFLGVSCPRLHILHLSHHHSRHFHPHAPPTLAPLHDHSTRKS